MKIGQIYKFNYQSKSPSNKKYAEPVRIQLTEYKKAEVIKNIQAYADKAELDHIALTNQLTEQKFFENIKTLEQLDAERKARSARARKTEEQKNLEIIIEGQYDAFIKKFANENKQEKQKDIVDLFFRQYSLSGITLDEEGANEAILVSKNYSKTGSDIYRFISLTPVIVDKSELYKLDGFEYV